MGGSRRTPYLLIPAVFLAAGCTSSPWAMVNRPADTPALAASDEATTAPPATDLASSPSAPASVATFPPAEPLRKHPAAPTTSTPDPAAAASTSAAKPVTLELQELIAEIKSFSQIDPTIRQEAVELLQQAEPAHRPLLIRQYRAWLAMRQHVEKQAANPPAPEVTQGETVFEPAPQANQTAHQASQTAVWSNPFLADHRQPHEQVVEKAVENKVAPAPYTHTGHVVPPDPTAPSPASSTAPTPVPSSLASSTAAPSSVENQNASRPPAPQPPDFSPLPPRPAANNPHDRVVSAAYETESPGEWRRDLAEAIRGLESQLAQSPDDVAEQARLRMLYLAARQRDDALRAIPSLDPAMQDFWSKELFGLGTLLDTELISDSSRRRAEAKRSLDEAVIRLGESSPLVVHNLHFVTEMQSYGAFKPFDRYEFIPGQNVLLYAEVENFKSEELSRGFHTILRSSYQILDSRGQYVADHEFETSEEYCGNPRRDFFIGYEFALPEKIYPGKYTLRLRVVDLNSDKMDESSIKFEIKRIDE